MLILLPQAGIFFWFFVMEFCHFDLEMFWNFLAKFIWDPALTIYKSSEVTKTK